jgi:hypothetical protein
MLVRNRIMFASLEILCHHKCVCPIGGGRSFAFGCERFRMLKTACKIHANVLLSEARTSSGMYELV